MLLNKEADRTLSQLALELMMIDYLPQTGQHDQGGTIPWQPAGLTGLHTTPSHMDVSPVAPECTSHNIEKLFTIMTYLVLQCYISIIDNFVLRV